MKRILIVDDEQPIISGLSLVIKRYFADEYTIVGSASSGREAIEKARDLVPDIVLMDVQMPGISGLEAIKSISSLGGSKAFVLITAYERFDIAREALSLGVCDYILKPVARERLEIALHSAAQFVDRSRELEKLKLQLAEQDHQAAPLIKDAFFYRIKNGVSYQRELSIIRKTLNLQSEYAAIVIAFIRASDDEPVTGLYKRLSEYVQYKTEALIGSLEEGQYAPILVSLKKQDTEKLQKVLQNLESAFAPEINLGKLSLFPGEILPLESLHDSWDTALNQILLRSRALHSNESLIWPPALERELASAARDANLGQIQRIYETILEQLMVQGIHGSEDLYRFLGIISLIVGQLAESASLSDQEIKQLLDYRELISLWEHKLLSSFLERAREKLSRILERAREKRKISPTAKRALQYMENHFAEPISLEQVAEILGIAPASLSRLFSEELGTGFARTLIEYRLKRAKELLRQGNLSIKDVSTACGYQDPNYFTRLFKNWIGMTPTEYVEFLRQNPEGADTL